MSNYKQIVVVIDPSHEEQPALERAKLLATHCGASVTLFMSIYDFSYEMTSMLSADDRETLRQGVLDQRQRWLEKLAEPLRQVGIEVATELAWHNRPFESIIEFAMRSEADLILKGTRVHDKLKSVIFTPTDWSLMRKAPMPVLLVKAQEWPQQGVILVAVNVGAEDEAHLQLNQQLIEQAKAVANINNGQVHLVNGYPGTPVNIAVELPDFDAQSYNNALREHHQQRIEELASNNGIDKSHCHVVEGMPEDVIPDLATSMDAELVVIGTIGRTGLSAALIGNTAEHVIDQLDCDLLALKPDSFVSPVTL